MSFFSASYQTSEQLELSRIARSSSSPSQQQQQQSTSLLRSNRQIPEELRPPPFNPPQEEIEEEELVDEENPFGERIQGRTEQVFAVGERTSFQSNATSSAERRRMGEQEKEKKRARTSEVGRMLFPPSTTLNGSPRSKRLSLPGSTSSNLPPVHLNPLSASTSSIPIASSRTFLPTHTLKHPTKKTLSPSHAQRRSVSSHPPSSSSSSSQSSAPTSVQDGTLLALPLAKQLESLKERNASLAQSTSNSNAKLVKATERIRQLEESLTKAEESRGIDAEGWEAEASRLAHELQTLQQSNEVEIDSRVSAMERSLELEQGRKRRAKEMVAKLRCELINRRWKEKYEIELLEREERNWEIRTVELEFELAVFKGELSSERLEREELQTIVDTQKKRISALTASRKLLLESFNTSEGTISSLRSSLSEAKSDLALRVEEVKGYKAQVIDLEESLEEAKEKGSEDGKLREKKEQLENEVKELKAQVKASQTSLKSVEKSASLTQSSLESTQNALSSLQAQYDALIAATASKPRSPVAVKEKEKKRKAAVVVPEPEPEIEEEEDEEESTIKPPPKPKAKVPAKEKKKVVSNKPVEPELSEEDSEDMYRPVVTKEASPAPVKKAPKATKTKPAKVVEEEVEEEDEDETPRAAPVPVRVPAKKRKAEVLSDKSVNSSKGVKKAVGLKVKKGKTTEKKNLSLDLSEAEAEEEEEEEEPKAQPQKKKKKKKLFGGGERKAFDWQTGIENADVNGIIPDYLSPIKLNGKKKGITGLTLGGGKKSIF